MTLVTSKKNGELSIDFTSWIRWTWLSVLLPFTYALFAALVSETSSQAASPQTWTELIYQAFLKPEDHSWLTATFRALSAALMMVLMACGSFMIGGITGFLFGLPRARENKDEGTDAGTHYTDSTSLGQVADWLTKILLGVGLAQLSAIFGIFDQIGKLFETTLGGVPGAYVAGSATVIAYTIVGFILVYLWSTMRLRQDLNNIQTNLLRSDLDVLKKDKFDGDRALELTHRLFVIGHNKDKEDIDLEQAFKSISLRVQSEIYMLARNIRKEYWRCPGEGKQLVTAAAQVFEALVQVKPDNHRYHGQLGFALKDQAAPDWQGAEAALTEAIRLREEVQHQGWPLYEYNRAICCIALDPAVDRSSTPIGSVTKSEPYLVEQVLKDLRKASLDYRTRAIMVQSHVVELDPWLEMNGKQWARDVDSRQFNHPTLTRPVTLRNSTYNVLAEAEGLSRQNTADTGYTSTRFVLLAMVAYLNRQQNKDCLEDRDRALAVELEQFISDSRLEPVFVPSMAKGELAISNDRKLSVCVRRSLDILSRTETYQAEAIDLMTFFCSLALHSTGKSAKHLRGDGVQGSDWWQQYRDRFIGANKLRDNGESENEVLRVEADGYQSPVQPL